MREILFADIEGAHQRLADAKAVYHASARTADDQQIYATIKAEVNALRKAYRQQEAAAGRRLGMVGGDADQGG